MSIIHIEDGIIGTAKQLPSPNHNDRPDDTCIRAIVIHNISLPPDEFAQTDASCQGTVYQSASLGFPPLF